MRRILDRSAGLLLGLDIAAENRIQAGLITGAVGFEPVDDFGGQADSELLLWQGKTDLDGIPIDLSFFADINRGFELCSVMESRRASLVRSSPRRGIASSSCSA